MNIVIVSQKPIQVIKLIYLLGSIDVFPSAVVIVKPSRNHIAKDLLDDYSANTVSTLDFQCKVLNISLYKVDNVINSKTINLLKSLKIDLILQVVLDVIVNNDFISTSKYGVVSSHGGILPKYRGVDCSKWCVLNNEKEVGVSTILLNTGVDTGNIISKGKVNIKKELPCTISELEKKIYYRHKLFAYLNPVKQLINNGKIRFKKQKINEGCQYFSMHPKLEVLVDLILKKRNKKK
tara:strand:+ start:19262 stop:19969 length:708 start_codon:yes stop_codon:yes gene_type:complete